MPCRLGVGALGSDGSAPALWRPVTYGSARAGPARERGAQGRAQGRANRPQGGSFFPHRPPRAPPARGCAAPRGGEAQRTDPRHSANWL